MRKQMILVTMSLMLTLVPTTTADHAAGECSPGADSGATAVDAGDETIYVASRSGTPPTTLRTAYVYLESNELDGLQSGNRHLRGLATVGPVTSGDAGIYRDNVAYQTCGHGPDILLL